MGINFLCPQSGKSWWNKARVFRVFQVFPPPSHHQGFSVVKEIYDLTIHCSVKLMPGWILKWDLAGKGRFSESQTLFALKAQVTCRADGLSAITLAASRRARDAFCSPSAAMTWKKVEETKRLWVCFWYYLFVCLKGMHLTPHNFGMWVTTKNVEHGNGTGFLSKGFQKWWIEYFDAANPNEIS